MSSPNLGIAYQSPLVSYGGTVGDCVVQKADGSFVLATTAARSDGTRTAYVVTQLGINGSALLQPSGTLDTSITGLAAGAASFLRASATGRIERVASPTAADDVVGACDPSGVAHLFPGFPATAAIGVSYALDLGGTNGAQFVRGLSGDAFGVVAVSAAAFDATGVGTGLARTKDLTTRTVMTGALVSVLDIPVGTLTDLNAKIIVDISPSKRVRIDLARIQGGSVGPGLYTPTAIPDSVYAPNMGTGAGAATYDVNTYFDGTQYRVRVQVNAIAGSVASSTFSLVYA